MAKRDSGLAIVRQEQSVMSQLAAESGPPKTLRVLARGTAMVPPYHQEHGRRFVGRVFVAGRVVDGRQLGGEWHPSVEPESVPNDAEFRRELAEGALWPADAETAEAAGVPFDPDYGGEFVA